MMAIAIKRIVMLAFAGAMAMFFMRPASAQFGLPSLDLNPDSSRKLTPEEKEKLEEIDKQYKATIQKVPDKTKGAADPWADVRQSPSSTKQR